MRKETILAFW